MARSAEDLIGSLDRLVLAPRSGESTSAKPPVRIFVGTEPAQQRAERVLLRSIECHRDASRSYEILLMRELPGFDRSRWTSGFSGYGFATPALAGAQGRAIYNDVHQVYYADPGDLFDAELGGCGYLATAPDDPSVMLLDCARMAEVWPLETARRSGRTGLRRHVMRHKGLWGRLAAEWNARDAEFVAGRSKLLHFATPHTQPWRPFPERFVYQDHPHRVRWLELEGDSEAAGFRIFSRARPSVHCRAQIARAAPAGERSGAAPGLETLFGVADPAHFGPLGPRLVAHDVALREGLGAIRAETLLVYTLGHGAGWRAYLAGPVGNDPTLEQRWGVARVRVFDLAERRGEPDEPVEPVELADCVLCCGVLADLPVEDLPWILDEIFERAKTMVQLGIRLDPPPKARWRHSGFPILCRTVDWWSDEFDRAARRHPGIHWRAVFHGKRGVQMRQGGCRLGSDPPAVWVLTDDRPGSTSQSTGLADALGWPYVEKRLHFALRSRLHNRLLGASVAGVDLARSSPLMPPWPDLVIAAGRRAAPVAHWIRERNFGRTRLVQLGRKGGDAADGFDLVVSPSYARLDPHPRRIDTSVPLHGVTEARLADAAARWQGQLEGAARPRIAVLVGGWSGQYAFDAKTARRLGEAVVLLKSQTGGSILATTSRRAGAAGSEAFCSALQGAAQVHRWSANDADNPYLAFLASADAFVITGDSESMIAEAAFCGRPIYIFPLPVRRSFQWMRVVRDRVYAHAHARPKRYRGTVRVQRGLQFVCARLIDRGFVRPTRDLAQLHEELIRAGVARRFGDPFETGSVRSLSNREVVVERVRALIGAP